MSGLHGFTTSLWPVRYKPLDDELLSCWLMRLAHGHGMKVQTFCNLVFGNRHQVWNRDIDRLGPSWLIEPLALHTGTPIGVARGTTLRVYEGIVYPHFRSSGVLPWIQSVMMYHRKHEGFGQQYCPACLANDKVPYFRKSWRLALKTFCVVHMCQLLDRCHACGVPVSFHRVDMGRARLVDEASLSRCHACGCDLAAAPRIAPKVLDQEAFDALVAIVGAIDAITNGNSTDLTVDTLNVLRHLTVVMLSRRRKVHLCEYLADLFGERPPVIDGGSRRSIETQSNATRHTLLLWAAWLLCSPKDRLAQACEARALLYNHLLLDFRNPPVWFVNSVIAAVEPGLVNGASRVRRTDGTFAVVPNSKTERARWPSDIY